MHSESKRIELSEILFISDFMACQTHLPAVCLLTVYLAAFCFGFLEFFTTPPSVHIYAKRQGCNLRLALLLRECHEG